MKSLILLSIIGGISLGALPDIVRFICSKKQIQIIEVEPFWKVNGSYARDGEIFEVFYPPLDKME